MPTGYTSTIKADTTLNQFVWTCARAFSALIEMRDDPMDAPIPKALEPSTYHRDRLVEAKARHAEISAWSEHDALLDLIAKRRSESESNARYDREKLATNEAYTRMLNLVEAWQPPSSDHIELKKFMIEQITGSIKFDCTPYDRPVKPVMTAAEWKALQLSAAVDDVAHHEVEWQKELTRTADRNDWISKLRESLAEASK